MTYLKTGIRSFHNHFFHTIIPLGDDISGSGSGMCNEQLCARSRPPVFGPKLDRPKLDAYSPEGKQVRGGGSPIVPSAFLIVVLIMISLLFRR